MADRQGFSGQAGDVAVITIRDSGAGVSFELSISHGVHAKESEESAVEAVCDVIFKALGRPNWKSALPSANGS